MHQQVNVLLFFNICLKWTILKLFDHSLVLFCLHLLIITTFIWHGSLFFFIRVACDSMESHKGDVRTIWIDSSVTYTIVVHSTWPSQAMWRLHAPTLNKWHKKNKTLHMLTHGAMRGCGLTSLVVCNNDKFCDIREGNVTIRSEIWTMNIRTLGFGDIRECVTLWWLILQSLRCTSFVSSTAKPVKPCQWIM